MPNRNSLHTFIGPRLYTRRQLLKSFGAGANNPTRKLSEGVEPTTANNPTRKLSEGEEPTTRMTMEIAEVTRLHKPL